MKQDVRETVSRKDGWDQFKSVMGTAEAGTPEVAPETKPHPTPPAPTAPQMPMLSSGLAGMHMAQQSMESVAHPGGKGD